MGLQPDSCSSRASSVFASEARVWAQKWEWLFKVTAQAALELEFESGCARKHALPQARLLLPPSLGEAT
jgi:hypothetical protein